MSLFIIVGTVLLALSIYEFNKRKTSNAAYWFAFLVLTAMLCFRYGQGTDYFAYQYIYEKLPDTLNIITLNKSSIHSEVGWKLLCVIFRKLGFSFYLFNGLVGAVTMLFLNRFIQKFCTLKVTALFIAYPTLYLTYIYSGVRQGLVMCVFLGLLLEWYLEKKNTKFIISVLLCTQIHSGALVLLILLLTPLKSFFIKHQGTIITMAWVIGLGLSVSGISLNFLGRSFTNEGFTTNIAAVAERLLTYFVIRFFYNRYKIVITSKNRFLTSIFYIYSMSMTLYGLFFSMPTVSSRICYFFKVVEIIIIIVMLSCSKEEFPDVSTLFFYIAALSMVMIIKNIDSYLTQGIYYDYVTVWNYPYNNIFEKGNYRFSIYQNLL